MTTTTTMNWYRVVIDTGHIGNYTAYEGKSKQLANRIGDIARNSIMRSGGRATVSIIVTGNDEFSQEYVIEDNSFTPNYIGGKV